MSIIDVVVLVGAGFLMGRYTRLKDLTEDITTATAAARGKMVSIKETVKAPKMRVISPTQRQNNSLDELETDSPTIKE